MKNLFLFIAGLAAAALTSCTYDFQEPDIYSEDYAILLSPTTSPSTKAPVSGTSFPDRNIVAAAYYYAPSGGTSGTFFSNLVFSKNGSVWTADKYWPLGGQLDLLAYSCPQLNPTPSYTGAKVTDEVTVTVGDNSSVQEDILYAYAAPTERVSNIGLVFKHAQALIGFKAKSDVAYNSTTNVGLTITGITLNGAKYSGTCLMKNDGTCTWSSLGSQTDLAVPGLSATNLTTTLSAQLGTGILVPEQASTTATITYTLHNGKQGGNALDNTGLLRTVTLTSPEGGWKAGKYYCYEISISQHEISVSPVVTEWEQAEPQTVIIP